MPLAIFLLWIAGPCFESGQYVGFVLSGKHYQGIENPEACQILCQEDPLCLYWTYWHVWSRDCRLQDGNAPEAAQPSDPLYWCTRGPKFCHGKQS